MVKTNQFRDFLSLRPHINLITKDLSDLYKREFEQETFAKHYLKTFDLNVDFHEIDAVRALESQQLDLAFLEMRLPSNPMQISKDDKDILAELKSSTDRLIEKYGEAGIEPEAAKIIIRTLKEQTKIKVIEYAQKELVYSPEMPLLPRK
jgi:hypothetical protein